MKCLANIICCGSAILAVGIASIVTLCSNRDMRGRRRRKRDKSQEFLKATVGAIARAAGYNNITLRVFSNPNFESLQDWGTDSDSDEDSTLSHQPSTSTSTAPPRRSGGIHIITKKGKLSILHDESDSVYSRTL